MKALGLSFLLVFVAAIIAMSLINPIGLAGLLGAHSFCFRGAKIEKSHEAKVIDVYDAKRGVSYFLGWIPRISKGEKKHSMDEITIALGVNSVTIYPGGDGRSLKDACDNREDCVAKRRNLFDVDGELYNFSFATYFYSKERGLLVQLPDGGLGELDGRRLSGSCDG